MAKWKYVGPVHTRGLLLRDGSKIFPENANTTDSAIEAILAKYPELRPYWRDATDTPGGVNEDLTGVEWTPVDFTPTKSSLSALSNFVQNI